MRFRNPVHVIVKDTTFGPHTKSFGVSISMVLNNGFDQLDFRIGRMGNNFTWVRKYDVALPPNFGDLGPLNQLGTIVSLIRGLPLPPGVSYPSSDDEVRMSYLHINKEGEVEG